MRQILLFTFILFGCEQTKQPDDSIAASQPTKDSVLMKKVESQTIVETDTLPKPTTQIVNFTNYLDSIGYIADTIRAKKTSHQLTNATIVLSDSKPFYLLSPTTHEIQKSKQFLKGNYIFDSLTVDYDIFLKPISIFAYYYRQNIKAEFIEDGIIEEWNFRTANEANQAFNELNKIKDMVYFNTNSFILQQDNYLYIFHTRASGFDITLRKFYTTFKQRRA
jgi:hypothetical protein